MQIVVKHRTPEEVAAILGVSANKVLGWIGTKELLAINVATRRSQRPRWKISEEAFQAFQANRSNVATLPDRQPKTRTRRAVPAVRQWIK